MRLLSTSLSLTFSSIVLPTRYCKIIVVAGISRTLFGVGAKIFTAGAMLTFGVVGAIGFTDSTGVGSLVCASAGSIETAFEENLVLHGLFLDLTSSRRNAKIHADDPTWS
jgi:hypothetical protein